MRTPFPYCWLAFGAIALCLCSAAAAADVAAWSASERKTFWESEQDASPQELFGINDAFKGRHYVAGDEYRLDLFAPKIKDLGGAYLGVGSDQGYLFVGWMRAQTAWLIDYDPLVVALHAAYRVFFLESPDGAAFLQRWSPKGAADSVALLRDKVPEAQRKGAIAAYRQSRGAVWVRLTRLRAMLKKAGQPAFVDDPAAYAHIQALLRAERIRPMSANLLEAKGLQGIAAAARTLGVQIKGLYLSNAEEYWPYSAQFRKNIAALPFGDGALVWRTLSGFKKNGDYCYHVQTAPSYLGYLQRKVWKVFAIMRCGDKTLEQSRELLFTDRVPPEPRPAGKPHLAKPAAR